MKKKELIFWAVVALLVFYFFLAFGVFLFQRQEESQLFIPTWDNIRMQIGQAGGCCAVIGQLIIQYYRLPMLAVTIHTLLALGIGFSVYKLLQGIKEANYHLLLALFPMLFLLKMSIRSSYLVDGTVAVFMMMLVLLPLLRLKGERQIALYGVLSTILLFGLGGLIALPYALLYVLVAALLYPTNGQRIQALWSLIPAILFGLFSQQLGVPVPFSEGFQSEEHLEVQLQPHAYLYYVWILFSVLLLGVLLVAYLFRRLALRSRRVEWGLALLSLCGAVAFGKYCLPDRWDIQNRMLDELSYLARERQWQTIIHRYEGREIQDYVSLNYLNMALAQEGKLADSMFAFDQRGTKSLVAPWNQSLFMTKMLCEVHFCIGDLGLAESYAMDAMTQSKRGGSARMLQRLVQINLLRGEKEVARKYLNLLEAMPFYREWAKRQEVYLAHPERMQEDKELRGKMLPSPERDNLFSLMTTDSLWAVHPPKSVGWEYRGCFYLLGKDLDKFRAFLTASGEADVPHHFQEAWLISEAAQDTLSYAPVIQPEVARRYQQFKKVLAIHSAQDVNMQAVYREFGDTYWFYYYFKMFKDKEAAK